MSQALRLQRARDKNSQDKPKAALKVLKRLFSRDPTNKDVVEELIYTYNILGQPHKTLDVVDHALEYLPYEPRWWYHRSCLHEERDELFALADIESGLKFDPHSLLLRQRQIALLFLFKGEKAVNEIIEQHLAIKPFDKKPLLLTRIEAYEKQALIIDEKKTSIIDSAGQRHMAEPLTLAVFDLCDLVRSYDDDWSLYAKRASLHKLLGHPSLAIADYERALHYLDKAKYNTREYLLRKLNSITRTAVLKIKE